MMIIIYLCPYSVDEYNQYDDNGQYNNQYNGDHDHATDDDNNNQYPDPYQQQYLPTNNEVVDNDDDDDNDGQHQYAPYEQIEHEYNDDDDVITGIDQHYPSSYLPNYQPNNYQSSYQTDYKTDYTPQSYTVPYDGINQYPQFSDDGVDDDHHSYGNDQLQYEADQKQQQQQQQQQSIFPQFNDDSVDSPGTHFIT